MRTRDFTRANTNAQLGRTTTVVRWLVAALVAVLLALCVVRPAHAQSSRLSRSQGYPLKYHDSSDPQVQEHVLRARAQRLSAADVGSFQANLQSLMNWLAQTTTNNPNQQAQVNDLQTQLSSLTSDQMTLLANSFDVNAFNTAVTLLTSTKPGPVAPSPDPPANLFPPPYGICAPTNGPPPIPSDTGSDKALLIAIEAAQAASIVADDTCSIIIDVAGAGTNIPQCIVALVVDLIAYGLETSQALLQFCDNYVQADEVEAGYENTIVIDTDLANLAANDTNSFTQIQNQLTTANTDIDNHISSIAGNTSTQFTQINNQLTAMNTSLSNQATAIDVDIDSHTAAIDLDLNNHLTSVDSDVKNTTTAIDTDIDNHLNQVDTDVLNQAKQINTNLGTFQTLAVRLEIEHALDLGLNIGLFELPQALSGYLETVRAIVSDAISKLLQAGQSVGTATASLAKGDTAFAAKQFKTAYQYYSAAYEAAVK